MALTAPPAQKEFPTVDQGTYVGKVSKVDIEDHTTTPDNFGKTGHTTLIFRWILIGQTDEDGAPVELVQYVKFATGDKPYTKGARAGKLPWLTEITRAFGEPDIVPGASVDPTQWVGKRAKLGVLEAYSVDGVRKNSINSVSRHEPKPKTNGKPAPVPVAEDDDESESIPF